MFFGLVEELVNERGHRFGGHPPMLLRLLHQAVILVERSALIGTEIVLLSVDWEVPEIATLAEERLWMMRHG